MTGARLSAIAVIVPDYDQAIAFYTKALGFRLAEDLPQVTPDGRAKRWVTLEPPGGGARLLLARADTDAQRAAIGNQCGGRVFLFLHTGNFARDQASLKAAGAVFEEEPRHEPYGIVAVWRDPFGNRWDLIQPSEQPH